jgi:hypothetical protein
MHQNNFFIFKIFFFYIKTIKKHKNNIFEEKKNFFFQKHNATTKTNTSFKRAYPSLVLESQLRPLIKVVIIFFQGNFKSYIKYILY